MEVMGFGTKAGQLASSIQFGVVNSNNVGALRVLNSAIFPVKYNNKFYDDILHTSSEFSFYGYLEGYVVSAICCRSEPLDDGTDMKKLYIMTLGWLRSTDIELQYLTMHITGVLEAYRNHQIGSKLLSRALEAAEKDTTVAEIYLHVQTNNATAIAFYRRFGFEITDTIPDYYKNIHPRDCYVLKRTF